MEADIRRTQNRLLEMAKQVTAILDKHNIRYTMYYGTLLGAIRHKGFIPWDDDFDLGVLDEQYDEGMEWLRMEMPESLFLEDGKSEPLYFHAWAHVADLKTMAKCVIICRIIFIHTTVHFALPSGQRCVCRWPPSVASGRV